MGQNTVTIAIKDYKEGNRKNTVTLTGVEFIRRFLMHILPKGFVKIRHYGILANRNKKTKLALCRKLTRSAERCFSNETGARDTKSLMYVLFLHKNKRREKIENP